MLNATTGPKLVKLLGSSSIPLILIGTGFCLKLTSSLCQKAQNRVMFVLDSCVMNFVFDLGHCYNLQRSSYKTRIMFVFRIWKIRVVCFWNCFLWTILWRVFLSQHFTYLHNEINDAIFVNFLGCDCDFALLFVITLIKDKTMRLNTKTVGNQTQK